MIADPQLQFRADARGPPDKGAQFVATSGSHGNGTLDFLSLRQVLATGRRVNEADIGHYRWTLADIPKAISESQARMLGTRFEKSEHAMVLIRSCNDEGAIERLDALAAQAKTLLRQFDLPTRAKREPGGEHRQKQRSRADQEVPALVSDETSTSSIRTSQRVAQHDLPSKAVVDDARRRASPRAFPTPRS